MFESIKYFLRVKLADMYTLHFRPALNLSIWAMSAFLPKIITLSMYAQQVTCLVMLVCVCMYVPKKLAADFLPLENILLV